MKEAPERDRPERPALKTPDEFRAARPVAPRSPWTRGGDRRWLRRYGFELGAVLVVLLVAWVLPPAAVLLGLLAARVAWDRASERSG